VEPIAIAVQPRLEEFREAYRALNPRAVSLGIMAIGCAVLFVLELRELTDDALFGAVLALTLFMIFLFGRSAYAALVRMPARAYAFIASTGPTTYVVNESGMAVTTALGSALSLWPAFKRFIETENTLLLVGHNGFLYIVPKSDVPTDRLNDLHALLKAAISSGSPTP